jgi:hypothetical protein
MLKGQISKNLTRIKNPRRENPERINMRKMPMAKMNQEILVKKVTAPVGVDLSVIDGREKKHGLIQTLKPKEALTVVGIMIPKEKSVV